MRKAGEVDEVQTPEMHHHSRTFQEEFRMLSKEHRVKYEEAYVWG
jgi:hypothetical protein